MKQETISGLSLDFFASGLGCCHLVTYLAGAEGPGRKNLRPPSRFFCTGVWMAWLGHLPRRGLRPRQKKSETTL